MLLEIRTAIRKEIGINLTNAFTTDYIVSKVIIGASEVSFFVNRRQEGWGTDVCGEAGPTVFRVFEQWRVRQDNAGRWCGWSEMEVLERSWTNEWIVSPSCQWVGSWQFWESLLTSHPPRRMKNLTLSSNDAERPSYREVSVINKHKMRLQQRIWYTCWEGGLPESRYSYSKLGCFEFRDKSFTRVWFAVTLGSTKFLSNHKRWFKRWTQLENSISMRDSDPRGAVTGPIR